MHTASRCLSENPDAYLKPTTISYSAFQIATRYAKYYLCSSNGKGHGIHSPFVFNFITSVLNDKRHYYAYDEIEQMRQSLYRDRSSIVVNDFGAGPSSGQREQRRICDIARSAAKPVKYAQLLHRIVNYYRLKSILELGTSLGISTAYMAKANPCAQIITCEGSDAIAAAAVGNFQKLGIGNTRVVEGNFDETLPVLLDHQTKFDLVFVDGNHRYEPTMRYFDWLKAAINPGGWIIFDDIHWSEEMEQAWEQIRQDPAVTTTIDLFFLGIVFVNPDFRHRQHFLIRF